MTVYVLAPENNSASGGIKILYRHADVLNQAGIDADAPTGHAAVLVTSPSVAGGLMLLGLYPARLAADRQGKLLPPALRRLHRGDVFEAVLGASSREPDLDLPR